jgi:hypothetical protein
MKKGILILCLLFFAFEGYSQKFGWGVTMGPNFGLIGGKGYRGDAIVGQEAASLFHGGFILQYRPRRFFTIYTGAEYVMKGANMNSNQNGFPYGSSINKLRLNYMEVPIFVKLNLDPYSDIRPNVFAGPTLGFLISGGDNYLLPQSGESPAGPILNTEVYYKSFDPGFAMGAGLDIDLGDWLIFTMGAQYVHSFRNVVGDEDYIFYSEATDLRHRNIRLNFGLIFVVPTYTLNNTGKKKKEDFKKFKKYLY